jgi:hypothetical protein
MKISGERSREGS